MFGRVTHASGAWHSGRCPEEHMLLYVADGTVNMYIGDMLCRAATGDILLIPRGTQYRPGQGGECTYYVFHFDMDELQQERTPGLAVSTLDEGCEGFAYSFPHTKNNTVKLTTHFTPGNQAALRELVERAGRLDVTRDAGQKLLLDLYFRELLVTLALSGQEDAEMSATAKKIVRYIHDNIRRPISLETVAEEMYLSESYVARIFKRELRTSVGHYITRQKMRLGCAMLTNTDLPIAEIARQIGFANQYYFSSTFSRQMGMTPTAYRKRN